MCRSVLERTFCPMWNSFNILKINQLLFITLLFAQSTSRLRSSFTQETSFTSTSLLGQRAVGQRRPPSPAQPTPAAARPRGPALPLVRGRESPERGLCCAFRTSRQSRLLMLPAAGSAAGGQCPSTQRRCARRRREEATSPAPNANKHLGWWPGASAINSPVPSGDWCAAPGQLSALLPRS